MANIKRITGPALAALMIFMKSTKLLVIVKTLKFTKPLVTVISMLISAVAYGIWLGPMFGVGLVAILFVHEMGHIIALRQRGFETHGPVFIPFLGALIFAPKFDDRDTEAYVGFGGPLLGTMCAFVTFLAWYATGSEIMILLTYVGAFLNLFNMIPLSPLDGGRVTQAVGSWFKWAGLAMMLLYTVMMREPSILLLWILILDGFPNAPLWMRPILAAGINCVMTLFMLLGYSGQPWWIDGIDIFLASSITFFMYINDRMRSRNEDVPKPDLRPAASPADRRKWLFCYLILTAVLSGLLVFTVGHLPAKVKTDAATMAAPAPENDHAKD